MSQPMLKLTGVFVGIIAAACVVAALIPALCAIIAALGILLPSVVILMLAWPIIWLSRACFGLPWSWDYVCAKIREMREKAKPEDAGS
ncbi:hypothetical protein [Geminisphaera colitermitum]|uniref:hypothetical protein n=1 Tax=Geminisphaera colitermitum TaxID=1148786 RepID=UPI00030628C9|nr:hypothetical protein [Geminisphaera colitermitum]RRK02581.1 hypothetical protein Ga0100230_005560 [Opitutaceae bacterium TAV3]